MGFIVMPKRKVRQKSSTQQPSGFTQPMTTHARDAVGRVAELEAELKRLRLHRSFLLSVLTTTGTGPSLMQADRHRNLYREIVVEDAALVLSRIG
jgi:hypothetical protein